MPEFAEAVRSLMEIPGVTKCAIVDIESGQCLIQNGVRANAYCDSAGLVNARMLRSEMRMVHDEDAEQIEDILVTLNRHYHLIRLVHPANTPPCIFLYLVVERVRANLAIARRKLADVEQTLVDMPDALERIEIERLRALNATFGNEELCSKVDDMPAFLQDDVVLKLLGITGEPTDVSAFLEVAGSQTD